MPVIAAERGYQHQTVAVDDRYESIVARALPDLRPVVTSSTRGIPKALPKIRPFETLKITR